MPEGCECVRKEGGGGGNDASSRRFSLASGGLQILHGTYCLPHQYHLQTKIVQRLGGLSVQVDVRSAAVGGRRGDPRRQGARSGAGALRNLWQNMWRNNGEGEAPAEGTPGFQVDFNTVSIVCGAHSSQSTHCKIAA